MEAVDPAMKVMLARILAQLALRVIELEAAMVDAVGEASANRPGINVALEHVLDALGTSDDVETIRIVERHQPRPHRIEGGAIAIFAHDLEIACRFALERPRVEFGCSPHQ